MFAIKELEKHPEVSVGAVAGALADLPAPGAPEQRDSDIAPAEAALLRLRAACKERAIDLRPMFGDHDE